jgi:MFS family permease
MINVENTLPDTNDAREPSSGTSHKALLHSPHFVVFWVGQTFSSLGNAFAVLAMPLLILSITGSILQMGIVTGILGVSQFVSSMTAGILVDRLNRRALMITCDVLRSALFFVIPLYWWLVGPQIWIIYVIVAVTSYLGMIFQVGQATAVPYLVEKEQLPLANSLVQGALALAFVLGPVLAGVVSATLGPTTAISINALSFAISALSLCCIKFKSPAPGKTVNEGTRWKAALAGLRFLAREPFLRTLAILNAGYFLLTAAGLDLFMFHLKQDLGNSDNTIGLVFGIASLGTIFGSLLAPLLQKRLGFGTVWLGGFALSSLVIASIGFTTNVWLMGLWGILFTFGDIVVVVCSMIARQTIPPTQIMGRVMAIFMTLTLLPQALGATFITLLAAKFGTTWVLFAMGIAGLLLVAIGACTPVRQRQPATQTTLTDVTL